MSGFVIGLAVLFLMAAGFVWGREGIGWSKTGIWRSFTVNDFYGFMFHRKIRIGDGAVSDLMVWMAGVDLGIAFIGIGLAIYFFGARAAKN
ncbi:MAG: hypothetical protein O7C63_05445 [Alphaproteobacteria bacterium]|nr:hypothetical protein [Alphaproteobacteria bacterium]